MKKFSVDRIEDEMIHCISDAGEKIIIPKKDFSDAEEGAVYLYDGETFCKDIELTQARRLEVRSILERLKKK